MYSLSCLGYLVLFCWRRCSECLLSDAIVHKVYCVIWLFCALLMICKELFIKQYIFCSCCSCKPYVLSYLVYYLDSGYDCYYLPSWTADDLHVCFYVSLRYCAQAILAMHIFPIGLVLRLPWMYLYHLDLCSCFLFFCSCSILSAMLVLLFEHWLLNLFCYWVTEGTYVWQFFCNTCRTKYSQVGQGWLHHQEAAKDPLQVPRKEGPWSKTEGQALWLWYTAAALVYSVRCHVNLYLRSLFFRVLQYMLIWSPCR